MLPLDLILIHILVSVHKFYLLLPRIFIDPYVRGDVNYYMSYFARDVNRSGDFVCNVKDNLIDNPNPANIITGGPWRGCPIDIYIQARPLPYR